VDGGEHVSELRQTISSLFIPQLIYEHVEPLWNDIDRERLLTPSPELSGNPTNSHQVAKHEELEKVMMNLALRSIFCSHIEGF
jgi:hypothetical protein